MRGVRAHVEISIGLKENDEHEKYVSMCAYVCTCECVCIYVCLCVCVCGFVHVLACLCVFACVCDGFVNVCVKMCVCVLVHHPNVLKIPSDLCCLLE